MNTEDIHAAQFCDYTSVHDPFNWSNLPIKHFTAEHDLTGLGPWGPYGKRYFGLSYLPGPSGVRVDIVAALELHRRRIAIPHAIQESGYLPWSSDSDFKRYSYRQQILPKDELYANVTFEQCTNNTYKLRVDWHNQTAMKRDVRLHLCVGLQPFAEGSWQPQTIEAVDILLPTGAAWIEALDYLSADFGHWPAVGLNQDGQKQGECLQDGFVGGMGMEWPSDEAAHSVHYILPKYCGRRLQMRYISDQEVRVELRAGDWVKPITLPLTGSVALSPVMELPDSAEAFSLHGTDIGSLRLDGIAVYSEIPPSYKARASGFAELETLGKGSYRLNWAGLNGCLELGLGQSTINRRYKGDLEQGLLVGMHDHVSETFNTSGTGHFHDFVFRREMVPPRSSLSSEYTLHWSTKDPASPKEPSQKRITTVPDLPRADEVRFGVDRLAAVVLTNIVYPVRTKGGVIRHYPPGRWWDMLYTWDCGFIGLGLAELAPRRAVELLNTYVCDPGDTDCTYIHHGSPVPMQHYLYFDLWQKTQDRDLLAFFYPRLSQYLRYLAGLDERSTTRPFSNRLLTSWSLFYNSGGWDDYPPQYYLHSQKNNELRSRTAPMVLSSHVAAAADILAMAAQELGEDPLEWEQLATGLAADMDAYAWDSESGLYGYVIHDSNGDAINILRHTPIGVSYNLGLDGAMPLLTGRIDAMRSGLIRKGLADKKRFFTELGLSTVDRTAPYYSDSGYWNGATWIPYQYIFWKSALDAGDSNFARELAWRVLSLYNRETEDSYCCFEHFINESGRGAGWHHFGGLSSPVINFFAAYFRPGRITTGFRAWIHQQQWEPEAKGARFKVSTLNSTHSNDPIILVTLNPEINPQVKIAGAYAEALQPYPGLLEIRLKKATAHQHIEIFNG